MPAQIKSMLKPNEKIIAKARIHPIIFAKGILWFGIGYVFTRAFSSWYQESVFWHRFGSEILYHLPFLKDVSLYIGLPLMFFGAYSFLSSCIKVISNKLIITNSRIIAQSGIANITTTQIERYKISGITIDQSALGRMLGYGVVMLKGFSGHIVDFPAIYSPHKFVAKISP